jgi:uncharacterized damage-inducible protein DinB
MSRDSIAAFEAEYSRYKALADAAIAQLSDAQLCAKATAESNSIATICWHVSGNLASRFTDFLTTDGEKSWRAREEEFATRDVTRAELTAKWEAGWKVLLNTMQSLHDEDLGRTVTIRKLPLTVRDALLRSIAHVALHVGQIVFVAKMMRGAEWKYLSIPPGKSDEYNRNPSFDKPDASVAHFKEVTSA